MTTYVHGRRGRRLRGPVPALLAGGEDHRPPQGPSGPYRHPFSSGLRGSLFVPVLSERAPSGPARAVPRARSPGTERPCFHACIVIALPLLQREGRF